jgi:hypothetical protein
MDDGSKRPVAQLAILPGFTHYNILSSPALPVVMTSFLSGPSGDRNRTSGLSRAGSDVLNE